MLDEWDYVTSLSEAVEDDQPDFVCNIGKTWAVMQCSPPPPPTAEPIAGIRARLREQMISATFSDQTGVWLFRHAPGVGKTYTFGKVADELCDLGHQVIMCAPTVEEAERMAAAARTQKVLRSQGAQNCQQAAIEETQRGARPLEAHRAGRHRGSDFCRACPYRDDCASTPGQYRHDQKEFHRAVSNGTAYYSMTVSMLEYVAHAINDSKHRTVVWTDEDLFPHVAKAVELPVTREEVSEWITHAVAVSFDGPDLEFMQEVMALLSSSPPEAESPGTCEDHSTGRGREFTIPAGQRDALREMAEGVIKRLGSGTTHPTEMMGEDGVSLAPGSWRKATIRLAAELVMGACWVHIDRSDYRSLTGKLINRAILSLPAKHALLQSDATASPALWSRVWGRHYRGHYDCQPPRAVLVQWLVGGIGRTGKEKESSIGALVGRVAHSAKAGKRVGVITYKEWGEPVKKRLRGKGISVHHLGGAGDGREGAAVTLGHYGAHDRGVDAFHKAGLDELYIVGPYRIPMDEYHQRTMALIEMGAEIPAGRGDSRARVGPTAINGEYLVQAANRATVCQDDPRTSWVVDHERAAALTQVVERIRSVDRAAKGMGPALVVLWGLDACRPHIALPLEYKY